MDGFDINPEFIEYSTNRSRQLGLDSKVKLTLGDARQLHLPSATYALGSCLGALYIFRELAWQQVCPKRQNRWLCRRFRSGLPETSPKEIGIFFEEPGEPPTLETARDWYKTREMRIVREVECSLQMDGILRPARRDTNADLTKAGRKQGIIERSTEGAH